MQLLAYEEAAAHFHEALHALELSPELNADEQCELLLALGDALAKGGETGEAAEAFKARRSLPASWGEDGIESAQAPGVDDEVGDGGEQIRGAGERGLAGELRRNGEQAPLNDAIVTSGIHVHGPDGAPAGGVNSAWACERRVPAASPMSP